MRLTASVPLLALAALASGSLPAQADTLIFKKRFNFWSVFTYENAIGTVCYAVAKPVVWAPAEASGAHAYFHIATRTDDKIRDEVSVSFGTPLNAAVPPEVVIKKARYALSVSNGRAFAPDRKSEQALLKAMKKGRGLAVLVVSKSGTPLEFRYSLRGLAKALAHVGKVCK